MLHEAICTSSAALQQQLKAVRRRLPPGVLLHAVPIDPQVWTTHTDPQPDGLEVEGSIPSQGKCLIKSLYNLFLTTSCAFRETSCYIGMKSRESFFKNIDAREIKVPRPSSWHGFPVPMKKLHFKKNMLNLSVQFNIR